MKKRIIAMLLAVAAVMSMIVVPVGAYDLSTVGAATDTAGNCPCGCNTAFDQIDWQKWDPNTNDPTNGHYYLEGNYVQNEEVRIVDGTEVVLDLRGYTLTTASASRVATVNGHFSVMDTVGGGRLSAITSTASGGVIVVLNNENNDACFSLYSGTITRDPASTKLPANGGLVFVYNGTEFYMHGGTLLGGKTSTQGGNICAQTNTVVSITGGSIIGGTAGKHGGNIYSGGEVTLTGCQVIGGTAACWGGNMYITGGTASLSAVGAVIRSGMAECDDSISEINNGGGNITCISGSTTSFTNCTISGGYSAKRGGNLFLGSGNHTLTGCTVSGGTAGMDGNNIYSTGNVTLDGCTVPGDVEYNSGNKLTLKGATKIGLLNTGLNIADTDAQVDVSGLTSGAEIYLNADGVTLANASKDYFKPANRTVLTPDGSSITAAYAADGETAGYCPHCDAQVAWTPLTTSDTLAETSGHFYIAADMTRTSQLTVGRNDNSNAVDAVIDLNGCTVTSSGRFAYIYSKAGNTTLSVMDSAGGGKVIGKGVSSSYFQGGGVIYNEKNLNIYGGKFVIDFDVTRGLSNGGVVYNGGVFNMYGGILDGSAYSQTTKDKVTTNEDGTTTTTAIDMYGGALYMGTGATRQFNMSAGHIIGGKAKNGGSIYFGYNNVANITGGSITGGTATNYGGNICMYFQSSANTSRQSANISISGCSITGGSSTKYGGNIFANWGSFDMDDCYVAGGKATSSYGGNLFFNATVKATVNDSVILGGSAKIGGNSHSAGTSVTLTYTDCLIANGKATGYGGNLCLGNGYNTIDGGAVLYGYANNTSDDATAYGGNISTSAGNASTTSENHSTIQGNTLIAGGYSETTGGNIQANGLLNLTSATIRGGVAQTYGQDIYLTKFTKQQLLTVGSEVTGDISFYAEESTHPIAYGQSIAYTAISSDLNANIYLENEGYGNPMLIAEGGALCVGAIAVKKTDGTVLWFADPADAVTAYDTGDILLLATDCEITPDQDCIIDVCGSTVTVHGNHKVFGMDSANDDYTTTTGKLIFADLETANTDAITPVSAGSMYVALTKGNTATYHRLDFGIDAISIRPTNCSIYYTGVWSCDATLAEKIDAYGIAVSLKDMPKVNFTEDETNMWTTPTEKLGVGVNSTSALIYGIMQDGDTYSDNAQTPVTAENNAERGKLPIYATAYVTIDGVTYISDDSTTTEDDVDYSLYSAMERMDQLIVEKPEQFRRYSNAMRAFYDIWDEYGMESWDFEQIFIPAEDDVIDLLMIGSSFCYYYVEELAQLAKEAGIKMRVCNAYESGCRLYEHHDWWQEGIKGYQFFETVIDADGNVKRTQVSKSASLEWCLMQGQWDVLSLQEHPTDVWKTSVEEHLEASRSDYTTLFTYLREQFPEARLLFQQTWAYQPGFDFSGYELAEGDIEQQTIDAAEIKEYAETVCSELKDLGVGIVPSGSAWQYVRTGQFGEAFDNLCARISVNGGVGDYYHEGDIGGAQYLNACVWFEVITGLDCQSYDSYIPYYADDDDIPVTDTALANTNAVRNGDGFSLTAEFVDILQKCAHQAVADAYPED